MDFNNALSINFKEVEDRKFKRVRLGRDDQEKFQLMLNLVPVELLTMNHEFSIKDLMKHVKKNLRIRNIDNTKTSYVTMIFDTLLIRQKNYNIIRVIETSVKISDEILRLVSWSSLSSWDRINIEEKVYQVNDLLINNGIKLKIGVIIEDLAEVVINPYDL